MIRTGFGKKGIIINNKHTTTKLFIEKLPDPLKTILCQFTIVVKMFQASVNVVARKNTHPIVAPAIVSAQQMNFGSAT